METLILSQYQIKVCRGTKLVKRAAIILKIRERTSARLAIFRTRTYSAQVNTQQREESNYFNKPMIFKDRMYHMGLALSIIPEMSQRYIPTIIRQAQKTKHETVLAGGEFKTNKRYLTNRETLRILKTDSNNKYRSKGR